MRLSTFIPICLCIAPNLVISAWFTGALNITDSLEIDAVARLTSLLFTAPRLSPILRNNTFSFNYLEEGHYVVRIVSRYQIFPMYNVDIKDDGNHLISIYDPELEHQTKEVKVDYPLIINTLEYYDFNFTKPPFSIMTALTGNPLILMLIVGGLLAYLMPKVLEYVDPEVMKEVRESQKGLHETMASLQNMDLAPLSKYLADSGNNSGSGTPLENPDSGRNTPALPMEEIKSSIAGSGNVRAGSPKVEGKKGRKRK